MALGGDDRSQGGDRYSRFLSSPCPHFTPGLQVDALWSVLLLLTITAELSALAAVCCLVLWGSERNEDTEVLRGGWCWLRLSAETKILDWFGLVWVFWRTIILACLRPPTVGFNLKLGES